MDEIKQIILGKELKERLKWLINLRWLAVIGVFGVITSTKYILKIELPLFPLYLGNTILLVYNLLFFFYNQRITFQEFKKSNRFANLQISLDLIMLTYFIYFTGGLENPFIFYFIFHIVIAGILLSNKAAYYQASLVIILLGLVIKGEYFKILPHYHLNGFIPEKFCLLNPRYLLGAFFVFATTLYIIVYMTTSIVNRLRKGEKELAIANKKLKEQDRLKSQYVLTVSHDLQTSLSTIQSCLKVVLSDFTGSISEKSREMIARAERRSMRVLHFIKDLLNLSKIRAGKEMEKKTVSSARIVKKVIEQLKPKAKEKKIKLMLENTAGDFLISVDPDAWEQVLVNLIVNAIKYTPTGGNVGVQIKEKWDSFQTVVWDTGIGIDQKDLPHIFEDFYRSKNAELMENSGTGLGLSIVKQIIKDHGGKIWCESQVGKGSTFTFTLPKDKK